MATSNAQAAETILRRLPPALNNTDEQALAIAEAQARATLAVAEAIEDLRLSLQTKAAILWEQSR